MSGRRAGVRQPERRREDAAVGLMAAPGDRDEKLGVGVGAVNIGREQQRNRAERVEIGLRRRDGMFFAGLERQHRVGLPRERRVRNVRQRNRGPALAPRLREHRRHVGRRARL